MVASAVGVAPRAPRATSTGPTPATSTGPTPAASAARSPVDAHPGVERGQPVERPSVAAHRRHRRGVLGEREQHRRAAQPARRAAASGHNVVRWMLTEAAAREVLVDWEREARNLLARLRAIAGRHPGHPRVTRLVAELTAASPEVREWWPQYDIQFSHAGRKRFRHPRLGEITVSHAAFHVAERPEQTLVVYQLPDSATDR
ncbi:hypothetical protein ODJ79_14080 [Actinoplanes sp. KI2]|uniref:MmyB family transcriptional regulator n=1 Tax=Actinoplanes sp. KI2 TaxID=2983315 RepID=UPI0021D5AEF4|nr:hypothetical protein [Actinoplanes sp. KI2]MCU7724850.1 hypothetical protein [Actinoplanes sp. KI2]